MNQELTEKKEKQLQKLLNELCREDTGIAFSGGVDSSLLLIMAWEQVKITGKRLYAFTMDTVLHPKGDLEAARAVIQRTDAIHVILKVDELTVPEIRENPIDRCYLCKKELYSRMSVYAQQEGIFTVLEGSNEDDMHVYRPGIRAVKELGIRSPLAECHITKEEVRYLAKKYKLQVAERPSSPCMATRLPYGQYIDLELLRRIDQAESMLRDRGYKNVRVRVHGNIMRLEIDSCDLKRVIEEREILLPRLKEFGFGYLTLDLEGFRSGSMDIEIPR